MTFVACRTSKETTLHATIVARFVARCSTLQTTLQIQQTKVLDLARAREKASYATPFFCSTSHIPIGHATRYNLPGATRKPPLCLVEHNSLTSAFDCKQS